MKILDCKFMRRAVALAAFLFLGGLALTALMGVPSGENTLAMVTVGYVGFLMILASPLLLLLVAIAAFFPGAENHSSPC